MIAFLRSLPPRRRTATLLGWGLLIASPFLLLAAISLAIGRNAFATYPVWSDELDYWRNLFTWDAVGFHTGYNGMLEEFARVGTLGANAHVLVFATSGDWALIKTLNGGTGFARLSELNRIV